jgi:hypothetical protein
LEPEPAELKAKSAELEAESAEFDSKSDKLLLSTTLLIPIMYEVKNLRFSSIFSKTLEFLDPSINQSRP